MASRGISALVCIKTALYLGKRDKVEEFAGSSAREKSSSRRTKGAKERK